MRPRKRFRYSGLALALVISLASIPHHAKAPRLEIERKPLSVEVVNQLTEDLLKKADQPPRLNPIPEKWMGPFSREDALNDPDKRISKDFHIPPILKKRVGFWFDIYTKYGASEHVLHHSRYPWIVFQVVDTSAIEANGNLHKWTRYHKARAEVRKQVKKTRARLIALSKRKSFRNLNKFDRNLYAALAELSGSRRSVFRQAATSLRTQLGQKDFILKGLKHSSRYLPYMEQEFLAEGLPVELTRIPFVESSFNPHAESKVGASGIWQIMPRTGKAYVIVNDNVDERNSPLKASLVAARLLKHNHKVLKDWPLAVTAYNHGAAGVRKALRKSRSKDLIQLINRYHKGSFKFASSNFFASFLAVLHAEKYHQEIFAGQLHNREQLLRYSIFKLAKPIRAKKLIKMVGVDKETFLTYNLDLKEAIQKNALVPRNFRFLLPLERQLDLEAKSHLGIQPVKSAEISNLKAPRS